ncbi:MAG: penicillin acylase family protein [Anaerolineales bacterium]|nr:penicillin acylase family protein [Anaerolineales bacterium]
MVRAIGRILSTILIIIIVFIAGLGLYGAIASRQSFPQIDGSIEVPGLQSEVEVIRDSMGVPHIYASTRGDLIRAMGYVHAQDRFFQMDFWRHLSTGRLSEMVGESQLETDKFLRSFGWERIARQEFETASPEMKSILEAYANGVNAYLADHQGSALSFEYVILRLLAPEYVPGPWEPISALTWAKAMAYDLSGNFGGWQDLERAQRYHELGPDRADELFISYPEEHPLILPNPPIEEGTSQDPELKPIAGIGGLSETFKVQMPFNGVLGESIGSNNWVISGDRTTTGEPILANDPHLGIQMPSIWYEIGLHCQPISEECPVNVTGFSFAGAPGVIIGHNERIAWGVTNVGPDVLDLYIEKINPENPNQYEVNGEWVDMTMMEEVIHVAGGEDISITVRYTKHGPVMSDVDDRFDDLAETTGLEVPSPYAVSVQWTALQPTKTFQAVLKYNEASNFDEFRDAMKDFAAPAQNFIYADVDGNIGYQTPGLIPIRDNGDGLFPVPGWTDEYDWTGHIPFEDLPTSYNPPQGYIVTANNAIVGPEYSYSISEVWDLGYRAQRIVDLIEVKSKISMEDIQAIQGDNHHAMGPILIPILNTLAFEDESVGEFARRLNGWDFQNDAESTEAAIFNVFWKQLLNATYGDELPGEVPGSSYGFRLIELLVEDPQSDWWDDVTTTDIEDRDEIFRRAFIAAVDELESSLGRNPDRWTWGDIHTRTFSSMLGIGPLGLVFNRGPFPSSGGSSLVNNLAWSENSDYQVVVLPSMRMIVDLSDLNNSITINTTGQSGHTGHEHYIDMAELYEDILYHVMLWERDQVEADAEGHLILSPAQ